MSDEELTGVEETSKVKNFQFLFAAASASASILSSETLGISFIKKGQGRCVADRKVLDSQFAQTIISE